MNPRLFSKVLPLSSSLSRCSSAAAVCAALAMACTASAASFSWDGDGDKADGADGGTGIWNAANQFWFDGTNDVAWPNTAVNTDTAVFAGTAGAVSLGTPIFANALRFDVTGYTIDNGGTAANTLTLSGTNPSIVTDTGITATISTVIAGSGWTKSGAGTLNLRGANTFTGPLAINEGTISASAANNLGAGGITLNGGTLLLQQTAQITLGAAQVINVGANGGTIDNAVAVKLLMNTAGGLTGSGTLTRNASANNTLANIFQISGANTGFTGAVVLNGGVTEVSANGLGTGASAGNTITVNTGAELVAANSTLANGVILNGGTISGDNGTSTFSGPITVNGSANIRLGDFFQNTSRNLNITGALVTGAGGSASNILTTTNSGSTGGPTGQTLTLNPTTGNNSGYLGQINVSGGNNVVFATANALTGGTVTVNTNANQMGGVGFGYDFGSTIPTFTHTRSGTTDGGVFGINTTLAASTALDLSTLGGGGMYLGSQTTGTYSATTLGAEGAIYRLGGGTGTLNVPNAVLVGTNSLVVGDARANGNGTVVLGGENTFTGGVTVNNGTLSVATINSVTGGTASSNLGAPTNVADGTIHLGSAATGVLRYTGSGETTDRVIDVTGAGAIDQAGTGNLKFTSDITVTGTGARSLTLQGAGSGTGEISGKIASSTLTIGKSGGGSWLLSAAGNSVQQLSLSGGTLDIGANGLSVLNGGASIIQATGSAAINATGGGGLTVSSASASDGGNIGAANGATLTINANLTVSGTGPLEIFSTANSTGVVVLNGTNTYSGNTFINSGVLSVSRIGDSGSTNSNLGSGTTISIGNSTSTGNTLRYTGAGETNNRILNLSATTGSAILEQSGTGLLKFTGNLSSSGAGSKTLTLQGSTSGTGELAGVIIDNNASNKTSLTKAGTGTWTLSGANAYSGATTVNGGSLVLNGETGSLNSATTLALNTGGTFSYLGKSTGSSQSLGALTVVSGQGTVSSTYGTSGNTSLTVASLARSAGASVNFVSSGGTNGTSNLITITGQASGFINQGTFFNGADFAYNNGTGASGFLRAPVYGTDTNFAVSTGGATLGTNSATTHVQLSTADVTAQTTASVATLKINGARNLTLASNATLTVANGGILATGGASTIKPASGAATVTSGAAELSIRVDGASDSLTINSVVAGSGGLTKSGAGTLTLANTANTFTGDIFVNGGTLAYAGTAGSADQTALGAAGARVITLTNGSILSPTSSSNPITNTKRFVVGTGGATFNVANGVTLQLDDGNQFSGTGDLTVTGAGNGTVLLSNQSFTFSGNVFVNSGTLKVTANGNVLGSTTGRTVTVASGGVLDVQSATLPLGLVLNGTGISAAGALVNSGTGAGGFSGPVSLAADTTIGGTGPITLSGNVSGAALTKVGTNVLTLSGSNSYGNTIINGGGVQFNSIAAFGGTGATVSAAAGTTVAAGYAIDQAFFGRISTPTNAITVALGVNSANDLDFNAAGLTNASLGATGAFTYTGTLTPNGTTYRLGGGGGTLTLSNANTLTGANDLNVTGSTVLLANTNNYTGATTITGGTLVVDAANATGGSNITVNSGGTLQIGTGGTTGGLGTGTLINNGTLVYRRSDDVTTADFTGTGGLVQATTSRLTINPATTTLNRLSFTAAGKIDIGSTDRSVGIDGGNAIQMNVSGTATLEATGGGKITIGANGMDVGAASGGTLIINPVIEGANNLDIFNSGGGTVVLNGANTYSGNTNIQTAVLSVGSLNSVATNPSLGTVHSESSNLGAPSTVAGGRINIGTSGTGATLRYTGTGETTDRVLNLNGTTGGAILDQSGTGLLKFTSDLTATGAGLKTLTLQGSTAGTGEIAGAIVDNSTTNKTSVTKVGSGKWILSGANTFTGNVTVNAGPLIITNSSALGTGTKTVTVAPTTNPTSLSSLQLDGSQGDITLPSSLSFSTSFDALSGGAPIAGTGAIVNLAGNNTIQGNFTLTAGGGGTTFNSLAGSLTLTGTITPNTIDRSVILRGDGNGVISGNMTTGSGAYRLVKEAGTGKWILSGTNTYNGVTTISSGTLQFAKQVSLYNNTSASWTAGNIVVNSGATLAFNVGGTGEFTEADVDKLKALGTAAGGFKSGSNLGLDTTNAADGNFTYPSAITNTNAGVNSVGLTKLGDNALTLTGANTYTGPTIVNDGTLVVNGSISGSTAVTVNNGGILGGIGGTIGTDATTVTVAGGGVIAPGGSGSSIGQLNIGTASGNSVAFAGTSGNNAVLSIEIDATSGASDRFTISGNLNLSSSFDQLTLTVLNGSVLTAPSYTILTYTGDLAGTFDNVVNLPGGYVVDYSTPGTVAISAVPEPGSAAMLLTGVASALGLGRFRRRRF